MFKSAMFKYVVFCLVVNFDSTKSVIFLSIQIWECALNYFTMEPVHELKLGICHLHNSEAACLNMFSLHPYMQMIPDRSNNLRDTQMQHVLHIYGWNF